MQTLTRCSRGTHTHWFRQLLQAAVSVLLAANLCFLAACTHHPMNVAAVNALAPLTLPDQTLTFEDVAQRVETPDLLVTDEAMREFVQRYTEGMPGDRARLMSLHRAVRGSATLGIEYDPEAGGAASETFHRGTANCLAYANMFVALAREAGLDAGYQWLKVRPEWTRSGERVMVRMHVNATVQLRRNEQFMVDIDPVPSRDVTGARPLQDFDAQALHHANTAMYALAAGDTEQAWLHSVRALQLSPGMAHLWVNVGAIYRFAGQHREAESAYMQALTLEPGNDSAMNNLVVLYELEGREQERRLWAARVERYRLENPYYQAWLGDQAVDNLDWVTARTHYRRALQKLPQDSHVLFSLGIASHELNDPQLASAYLQQAIEHATLRSDVDIYRTHLEAVQRDLAAES